jgi:hypothetical protein
MTWIDNSRLEAVGDGWYRFEMHLRNDNGTSPTPEDITTACAEVTRLMHPDLVTPSDRCTPQAPCRSRNDLHILMWGECFISPAARPPMEEHP